MRISEKTIEINFCSKLNYYFNNKLIWFGLTQEQEARLGFDVCSQLNGKLYIFQLKASNYVLKNGARQFKTPHDQLSNLWTLSQRAKRAVFYVLPNFGDTNEITKLATLNDYWFLDVNQIQNLPQPLTKNGTMRKNNIHYIDMSPPTATIHSEIVKTNLISINSFADLYESSGLSIEYFDKNFELFWETLKLFNNQTKCCFAI